MKLRNKKTGEIREFDKIGGFTLSYDYPSHYLADNTYNSLAELNEEWEDVLEEEVWYLGKRIGNYSMPKKEADIVTEKILAWKRLKDKGFRFDGVEVFSEGLLEIDGILPAIEKADNAERSKIVDDLWALFGEEEE